MNYSVRLIRVNDKKQIESLLREVRVDERAIPLLSEKLKHELILLKDIALRDAIIIKQQMLAIGAEAAVHRNVATLNKEYTDILLSGTIAQYKNFIESLRKQPFASLKTISNQIESLLNATSTTSPLICRAKNYTLKFDRTYIMGILNVTPDSFYDGGRYYEAAAAIEHGQRLYEEGADIIDVGGESTRPGSDPISVEVELERIIKVIEALAKLPIPISVDTYKARVAEAALAAGATIVNDISGLRFDSKMAEVVAKHNAAVVIMHIKGTPKTMQQNPTYSDLMGEIISYLREGIEIANRSGIKNEQIIVDPGIGFGKTPEHNLVILKQLSSLKSLSLPILVGPSRKSFIGYVLDTPVQERLEGTAACVCAAIFNGANMIRVHDVGYIGKVVRMVDAILASS